MVLESHLNVIFNGKSILYAKITVYQKIYFSKPCFKYYIDFLFS